ncbi:hypothetical protein JCM10914A_36970 [Paenibacillus sp. JCM 10914]
MWMAACKPKGKDEQGDDQDDELGQRIAATERNLMDDMVDDWLRYAGWSVRRRGF